MARRPNGDLVAWWGRADRWSGEDLCYYNDKSKCDAMLLHHYFCHLRPEPSELHPEHKEGTFIEELERRGFDIKTIKFSIRRKKVTP